MCVFSDCSSTVSKNTRTSSVILIPLDACVDGVDGRRVPERLRSLSAVSTTTPLLCLGVENGAAGFIRLTGLLGLKKYNIANTGVEVLRTDFKNQAASQPGAASFLCVLLQLQDATI